MKADLKKVLADLKQGHRLNCGESFEFVVEHAIRVAKCGDYSDAEQNRMMNGLMRELRTKAQAHCDGIGSTCLNPEVTNVEDLANTCNDNVWLVKWLVTARCMP
jgi:hypothetical protein